MISLQNAKELDEIASIGMEMKRSIARTAFKITESQLAEALTQLSSAFKRDGKDKDLK